MQFVIDRFEDNDLVVLETPERESLIVPRSHIPWYASEGDVLYLRSEGEWQGEVRYAVDEDETLRRLEAAIEPQSQLAES